MKSATVPQNFAVCNWLPTIVCNLQTLSCVEKDRTIRFESNHLVALGGNLNTGQSTGIMRKLCEEKLYQNLLSECNKTNRPNDGDNDSKKGQKIRKQDS